MKIKINEIIYEVIIDENIENHLKDNTVFSNKDTILEICKIIGIDIPRFCYRELLRPRSVCRLCLVEANNKLVTSCSTKITDNMEIITNSKRVIEARKKNLKLLIADHQQECLSCNKSIDCSLFHYANQYTINEIEYQVKAKDNGLIDDSSYSFVRDENKCIKCGICVQICSELQGVSALTYANKGQELRITTAYGVPIIDTECCFCGQCVLNCPTCALEEKDETVSVINVLNEKDLIVAAQLAPAVRVSLGEEFGYEPGKITTGKIVTALKLIGFDYVFDTQFAADITVMEEAKEFIDRLNKNERLPLFTSCCPAWVKFCEDFYPELTENLSTTKSPQQIFGSVFKTCFGKNPEQLRLVSIMPCVAKKTEARRYEFIGDVNYVLTTREIARMIKQQGIDFREIAESDFDSPFGNSSGAGTIFGATGGVCEATMRTVYYLMTNQTLIDFKQARGTDLLKEGELMINDRKIRFAVVHTLNKVKEIIKEKEKYDFIEVMACPFGCIGGGGQPIPTDIDIVKKRIEGLYNIDSMKKIRASYQNPDIKSFLSDKKLLHTHYVKRDLYQSLKDSD